MKVQEFLTANKAANVKKKNQYSKSTLEMTIIFARFICKTLLIAHDWIYQKYSQAAPRFLKGREF